MHVWCIVRRFIRLSRYRIETDKTAATTRHCTREKIPVFLLFSRDTSSGSDGARESRAHCAINWITTDDRGPSKSDLVGWATFHDDVQTRQVSLSEVEVIVAA